MADRGVAVGSLVRITVPYIDPAGHSIGDMMGEIVDRCWEPIPPNDPVEYFRNGGWTWAWDYLVQVVGRDYWFYREEFVVLQEASSGS